MLHKHLKLAPKIFLPAVIEVIMSNFNQRSIFKAIQATENSEGAGANVRRSIGESESIKNFTPFLIFDHFKVSPKSGFPDHPHRGQETITYVLKGHVDHEDFTGSSGSLGPGDLQFMTAGKGIVHAEMPRIDKATDGNIKHVEGLQLWVDLPQKLKSCRPRYRDLRKEEIPIAQPDDKVEVKVISGESCGVESRRNLAHTPVWYLDNTVKPGGKAIQSIPNGFNAFLYILDGEVMIHNRKFEAYTNVFFNTEGDGIEVRVSEFSSKPARFVIIAGQKLDQPIVQHGPFVETSSKKISKALLDYQGKTNGFERAAGWQSNIGKRMLKSKS